MKPVYSNVILAEGAHVAGICKLQLAPREWLEENIELDFDTGKITDAVNFIDDRDWLEIELTQESYEFDEKPKSNKSGSFYEISVAGILNKYTADAQQVLETYRYHEFIVLLTDKNNVQRLVGNEEKGMLLQHDHSNKSGAGEERLDVSLLMESEATAPVYDV